jgi:hypothetical protein
VQEGEKTMAAITVFAYNLFETIGIVRPRIEVMVREATDRCTERKPLRMQWVRGADSEGRKVLRIQWVEDAERM